MKKVLIIFGFLITFIVTSLAVNAKSNYLHTITLEKNNIGYNVILSTDKSINVTKKIKSANELELEIIGATSADTVNALYKGTDNIENLIVENNEPNKLKIYINANNIKDSTVVVQSADGGIVVMKDSFPIQKTIWIGCVLALFGIMLASAVKTTKEDSKIQIKKDIKSREIEMYKKYRKSLEKDISINSQKDFKMKSMIKKIDRKIDERLSSIV